MVIEGNPDMVPVNPVAGLTVVDVDAITGSPCAKEKVPVTVCVEGEVDVGVKDPLI